MASKKKYTAWQCKECEVDFYVTSKVKQITHCPKCGDSLFTERIKDIWLKRPINYRRPWSDEERQIIEAGLRLGKTHREISQELNGRTEKAVTRQIQQLRKRGVLI